MNWSVGKAMTEGSFLEEVDLERWADLRQVRRSGRAEWADRTGVVGAPWRGRGGGVGGKLKLEGTRGPDCRGQEQQGDTVLHGESSRGF